MGRVLKEELSIIETANIAPSIKPGHRLRCTSVPKSVTSVQNLRPDDRKARCVYTMRPSFVNSRKIAASNCPEVTAQEQSAKASTAQ